MPEFLHALLVSLQGSRLAEAVRGIDYLYPLLESGHILGIALRIGPVFTFDLRLLGLGRHAVSVTTAVRAVIQQSSASEYELARQYGVSR